MKHKGATTLEIVDFIVSSFSQYKGKERKIERVVRQVLEYNTYDYAVDDKGLIYALRWNISDNGDKAYVTDLCIRKDFRGKPSLIKYIIARGWSKFTYLKEISFDRLIKYPNREERTYKLIKFFKEENCGRQNRDSSTIATSSTNGRAVSSRIRKSSTNNSGSTAKIPARV